MTQPEKSFTEDELITIAFLASERAWRAHLARFANDAVPAPERALFGAEVKRCEEINRKANAMIREVRDVARR